MNNPSQLYIIKYNLKYALESPDISDAEKKQLRQVEHISKNIGRSFWVYAPIDLVATCWWIRRKIRKQEEIIGITGKLGAQGLMTKVPFITMFLTIRLVGVYHLSSEMSKKYMVENVQGILKKNNPQRDQFVNQMKSF